MLMKVVVENGVKKLVPLTADAGSGNPCGTIIITLSNTVPSGYLPLGAQFDTTQFPVLYAILGSDTIPTASALGLPTFSAGRYVIKATSGINENQADNVLSALTPVNEVALNNLHSVTSNAVANYVGGKIDTSTRTFNAIIGWTPVLTFANLTAGTYFIAVSVNEVMGDIQLFYNSSNVRIGEAGHKNGILIFTLTGLTTIDLMVYSNSAINNVTLNSMLKKIA